MTTQYPNALRLANLLKFGVMLGDDRDQAADELRRLHSVNEKLLEALEKAVDQAIWPSEAISKALPEARAAIAAAEGEA